MRLALLILLVFTIPICYATVYINEIVPDPKDDCSDCTEWIELYNDGNEKIDVANWTLTDKKDRHMYIKAEYTDTNSTEISAGGYLVIYPGNGSKRYIYLTNSKDTISLFNGTELIDETSYEFSSESDVAWARIPDGSDNWEKTEPTPGKSNKAAESDTESNEDEPETQASDDDEGETEIVRNQVVESKYSSEVEGRTVFISEQKESLIKPLLLLLVGLLAIVILLQLQLLSVQNG